MLCNGKENEKNRLKPRNEWRDKRRRKCNQVIKVRKREKNRKEVITFGNKKIESKQGNEGTNGVINLRNKTVIKF